MICTQSKPLPDSKRSRQSGFSLWELAILLGILGVVIVAGFTLLRSHQAQQIENARKAQLAAADHALAGFVADRGRLPCPDTTGDGNEDCSGSAQKGWLPVVTLGLNASAPARGVARLKYIVYRGAGADLTQLVDRYNPVKWDLTTTYSFNQLNVLDFCAGLTLAANAVPSSNSAYIPGAGGATVNVAYGLAESGIDRDGDGNLFDGLNVSTVPVLESPARASDTNYDDIVQTRSFYDLGNSFQCPQATRSVDAISMAVAIGDTVLDFTNANYVIGVQQIINASVATAMDATAIAISIAGLVDGPVTLATAVSVAIAALGLDFAADAAIGIASAGIGVQAVAVGIYATAIGLDITALIYSVNATAKAGASPPAGIPPVPPCDPNCQLANLQTVVNEANKSLIDAQTAATAADAAAAAALTIYNNNVTALFTTAHQYDSKGTHDALLTTALNDYKTYASAALAYNTAQGTVDALTKQQAGNNTAITQQQQTIATDTAALNADPTNVSLQAQLQSDQQTLTNLQTQAATLSTQLATANANVPTTQTTMNTAYTNYMTAYNAALAAYPGIAQLFIASSLSAANNSYYNTSTNSYVSLSTQATNADNVLTQAQATAASIQKSYNDLQTAINNGTAKATGGSALETYTGAEDILKQADAKGALK